MFCQLDALRQCLPSSLQRTLAELPESLDETYSRIVMDIKKGNRADAYRMLQCLAVAIRPLSVAELAELLAFDFDATKGGIPKLNSKWRWEDHEQAVLSTCSSLITIVPGDGSPVVQFSHFSVKEFLMSDRLVTSTKDISQYHIVVEDANTLTAKACLGFLLRDSVDDSDAVTGPLALYAAEHWVAHAKVKNVASRIRDGMEYLFDADRPYFSAWVKLYNADQRRWGSGMESKIQRGAAPLYHAAFLGLELIVEHLALKYPQYANTISGGGGTALHSASREGHVEVVRSLLKCDVEVDALGVEGMSPLQLASIDEALDVMQCLLEHGADANFQDDFGRTPLRLAVEMGHLGIIRMLFQRNADIHIQDKFGLTPLHKAVSRHIFDHNSLQVVRFLLEHGANPNARDNRRRTPLHLWPFHLEVSIRPEPARILLAHGADLEAEDEEGMTPLQCALAEGQEELAQFLSEYCSSS